ncbi:hypothetical protein ACOMHN_027258 [Nucella lapillus]
MLKASIVCIAYLALVAADKVKFKDCGSVESKINSVEVSGCSTFPCLFHKNTYVNVTVDFTANADIQNATNKVYGVVLGVKIPFPLPSLACKDMACPVSKGKTVVYKNAVLVEKNYPDVSVVVQWEVVDTNDKFVFCFAVPVKIVK